VNPLLAKPLEEEQAGLTETIVDYDQFFNGKRD
jgi:hypothetical protein